MKLPRETIIVRTFRRDVQQQINLLLDYIKVCECPDQKGIILNEVLVLREKIKPYDGNNVVLLSKKITITEVTLKSKL